MNLALNGNRLSLKNRLLTLTLIAVLITTFIVYQPSSARANQVSIACTNSATDAANINTAITGSSIGDEIVFKGTCLINQVIKLKGDRSYRGESRTGTVLQQASGASGLVGILVSEAFYDISPPLKTGTPISISSLTIQGTGSGSTSGIVLHSWQSVVKDVFINEMGGNGIRLTSVNFNNNPITNTQVNGQIIGNFIENSGKHGVYVEDPVNSVTDWQLTDNWISDSGEDGVHLENSAGWYIERNHIYGVRQNAINANRMFGTSISDNYIEGFGESPTLGTYYGITGIVQGNDPANSTGLPSAIGSTVANNRIFRLGNIDGELGNTGSTFWFIALDQNYETGAVNVNGNLIRGRNLASDKGISYSAGTGETLLVMSVDNLVTDVGTKRTPTASTTTVKYQTGY